jgi:drug/metabolite transporter (DMT)-like permease
MFSYGIQNFLFKVSAEKRCNSAWTTFSFMLTVAVISTALFFAWKEKVSSITLLLIISFLNAITFLITTLARMEALKHIAASVVFPVTRMSTVLVIIFSVAYFKDRITLFQMLGILLAIIAISILMRNNQKKTKTDRNYRLGTILIFIALVFSAMTTIISKFAAIHTNKLAFISASYILNTILVLSARNKLQSDRENPDHRNAVIIGIIIGITNFIGFYMLLKALEIGPLSIITTINSLYFVMAVLLAIIIYKEKLSKERALAIAFSIIAVILLRM